VRRPGRRVRRRRARLHGRALSATVELTLTADGELVVDAHRQMHEEMAKGLQDFLKRYGNADLEVLVKVLRDLLATKKTGLRIDVT
jgi:hypothetical protein